MKFYFNLRIKKNKKVQSIFNNTLIINKLMGYIRSMDCVDCLLDISPNSNK